MKTSNPLITSIAVVEDDIRIRRVLEEVFATCSTCECVGVFSTCASAIEGIPHLGPDVILMDINLPDGSGVDCVTRIAPLLPETQILMLTVYQDTDSIFAALSAGAHGYLVKPVMPMKLLEAIREIREGGVPMSRTIARKVVETFRHPAAAPAVAPAADDTGLSGREQQVLELLVGGYSYKEISDQLGVKLGTVSTYVQRIYEKLHVHTRREIIERYKSSSSPSASRQAAPPGASLSL
jgi:DNA-binding NarL/FixJ family response regulator